MTRELKKLITNLEKAEDKLCVLKMDLQELLKDKKIRITCPRYNGQVFGRSKPKLQGQIFKLRSYKIHFQDRKVFVFIDGHQDALFLDQFELLEDSQ